MMKFIVCSPAVFALSGALESNGALSSLSAAAELEDDAGMSLLQLRAASVDASAGLASPQKFFSNESSSQDVFNGHPFGCTGRSTAVDVISCGLYGDVHQHTRYHGHAGPDVNGVGWHWLAKSKDGSFQAQGFYRQVRGSTMMSHFAFKFGDQTLFMDRDKAMAPNDVGNTIETWAWKYIWNGEEKSAGDTPTEIGQLYWVNKVGGQMVNEGAKRTHGNTATLMRPASGRLSCFEIPGVAVWTSYQDWQAASVGPWAQPSIVEIEGSTEFLDDQAGQCALQKLKVLPAEMLVTLEQNDKVCSDNGMAGHECDDPDPPPPVLTKEELCERNGVAMSHAEELCADQQEHGSDIFEACTFDVCSSADAQAQLNAVGGAELEAALMNPEAKCTIKADDCLPCDICATSKSVDLSKVVQNNLGGLGPDSGVEEIRYKDAIQLDGKKVDVVLTTLDAYITPKSSKNGFKNGGFGVFTMKVKTSTNFKFSFEDSTTGELVAVPNLALTFYDLDQGKRGQQQETISACSAQEVYTTSDTELKHIKAGACHSFTSSMRGTGKDNPSKTNELTKTQAARSVTFEFHTKASISFSASISRAGRTPRPVLFSFEPQVACGASDAETQCAQ